ncbi:MAG: sugar phosphate isomerase/epimerase [Firmicutes bacterium]|nr:sugar phosphate isomerase/epimerase [[Eubacterium] siraeum]MCM1488139.1 sugar phosphate isomerase/epimerase [Bacillota bacterium]
MKTLIIPQTDDIEKSLALAEEYGSGFEYNEFFMPKVLDDESLAESITAKYKALPLPDHCTLHGAFYDIIPFSPDKKIREISDLRIKQSIYAAKNIGARAVVFHTNYNPFLNSPKYVEGWLEENVGYWSGILSRFPEIDIYLENMFDTSPHLLKRLAEELCRFGNFGVCFDYAHAALTKVPPREWSEALSGYVKHIHINDNDLVSDLHLAVGEGKIDWSEFYRLYDEFLSGAPILIETSSVRQQRASLERLKADGFLR